MSLPAEPKKHFCSPDSHTILLVEDERDIRETICEVLQLDGYKVESAVNGKDALEKLKRITRPCLILTDLMMPVMTGEEFVSELVRSHSVAALPIVVCSAAPDAAKKLPANAIIRKPIDLDVLLKCVESYCQRAF